MKIHRISLIAALALGGMLVCTTLATAQDAPKKKGRPTVEQRVDRLTKELSLTDEQKTKVTALLEDEGKKMREMRGDSNLDPQQRGEKMREMRKETDKKMKEILKPDQWEKYQKLMEEQRQKKGQGGPGGEKEKKDK